MMQPQAREVDSWLYYPVRSPVLTGNSGVSSTLSPSLPEKRVGMDPPEGKEDERISKKPRMGALFAGDTSFLRSPGRASFFGSIPDAALTRYLAEKQLPMARFYQPNPSRPHPSLLGGGLDFVGGVPTPVPGLLNAMAYPSVPSYRTTPMATLNPFMDSACLALPARHDQSLMPRLASQDATSLDMVSATKSVDRPGQKHEHDQYAHFSSRVCIDLSIEQDENWLSNLQCYTRKHLLEVCWATREDMAVRHVSKKVLLDQVGVRCRFCARKQPGSRAQRSSAFPSSIPQLYQSFTMMLRDHFDSCTSIPQDIKDKYLSLKSATCQGATEAKKYWSYSASKLGMVDSEDGIIMNETTRAAAKSIPAFGYVPGEIAAPEAATGGPVLLVDSTDHRIASGFLYTLMFHFQRIELLPSERKGNRKSLNVGLPGFGCRHCTQDGRFGMCRVFPARRRTLAVRVADMCDHICRCNLCPPDAKKVLQCLREDEERDSALEKKFLDIVWKRLGHSQANP